MKHAIRSFVGMDVLKATTSISTAEGGRSQPVRFIGVVLNTPEAVGKMAKQLTKLGELDFCYEARRCGYGIHRQLTGLRHKCTAAAPSMIPRNQERIKTDGRDSEKLAILHPSVDLSQSGSQKQPTKRSATWSGRESMLPCTSCGSPAVARIPPVSWSQLSNDKHLTRLHRCSLAGQTCQDRLTASSSGII